MLIYQKWDLTYSLCGWRYLNFPPQISYWFWNQFPSEIFWYYRWRRIQRLSRNSVYQTQGWLHWTLPSSHGFPYSLNRWFRPWSDIFMKPPKVPHNFCIPGLPSFTDRFTKFYKIFRNLCSLNDAGKTWFDFLKKGLIERGWSPSEIDPCLFDLFQPKMSPTLSFSGMYQKSFIYRRNRTNSQ